MPCCARQQQLAAAKLAQEKPGQTLQATALVREAYLRLVDVEKAQHWNSFAAAAEAMRRILVENARRKLRLRHGGTLQRQDGHRVDGPADRAGQTPGRRQAHQAGHGLLASPRPLRDGAASPGPDGSSEHREGAGCRHDGEIRAATVRERGEWAPPLRSGLGVPVANAPGSEGADAPGSEYPVANTPGSD
ncbi:MAG TPA: ECF-type sigma factor [Gemmataceae bacterium]|nr:ECF-type sigma factor [Gemmataceae bacterium]